MNDKISVQKSFNPKLFTTAPFQFSVKRKFLFSPENVWNIVADHQGMTTWMPMISHVEITNKGSEEKLGLNCERECKFGPDLLKEKIVHWDEPYGYAYMIADGSVPFASGHLGFIEIKPKEYGSEVVWYQYFRPKGFKGWMMKNFMMPWVMKKALKNLKSKLTKNH